MLKHGWLVCFDFLAFSLSKLTGKSSNAKITVVQFKNDPGQLLHFQSYLFISPDNIRAVSPFLQAS